MSRHLDKILAHAERQLSSTGEQRPTDVLHLYKKFLKIEEHRLRLKHQAGAGGQDICHRRVELLDVVLRHVFNAATTFSREKSSTTPTPFTVCAIGGYGRGELNPFSDVDLMFLHDGRVGKVSPFVSEIIEQLLYLLWDIGFKVGHSTRSVKEAIKQANEDMLTKTAMLEARWLTGDEELFALFRDQFQTKCVHGQQREYIAWRMEDQAARHAKFGNSVYMQEPHVKSGCGGLRDYQNLLWVTYFQQGILNTGGLVECKLLTEVDRQRLDAAYDFLLRVRTDLHYFNKRAAEILHLSQQGQIANRLHYPQKTLLRRSEAFMRDYYAQTRNIFRITERITEAIGADAWKPKTIFGFLPLSRPQEDHFGGFYTLNGQLYVEKNELFSKDPPQILQAFQHAQVRRVKLSPELLGTLTRRVHLVTKTFQYAKAPREIFEAILSRKGQVGRILRMMHEADILGRYIPEFGLLTCLVQHEFFHRYTADEHTLVCIDKLDALLDTDNPKLMEYRGLFQKLQDPFILYLAILMHDTGKGISARPHSEASALFADRVGKRLQLSSERRKALTLLVDHHITLSTTAQQRNIDDPATVVELANIIKYPANLDALMLLTLADGQGTSAESWSDWKEQLVWQLYHATLQYLSNQEEFFQQMRIERDELQKQVQRILDPSFEEEIEAHFENMPDNYFRAFSVQEVHRHVELFREFFNGLYTEVPVPLSPAIGWEALMEFGHTNVSICGWDRHQLLAKIAGSFSVVPINILSADIYTRGDNLVLDIFRVCNTRFEPITDKREIALVEATLRKALEKDDFDFAPLIEKARKKNTFRLSQELDFPTRITIDNRAHPSYTLVEIQTPDRLGLLYDLLACLGRENVYIALSRISTEKGAAIDTFYVTNLAERTKITESSRIARIQTVLHKAAVAELHSTTR